MPHIVINSSELGGRHNPHGLLSAQFAFLTAHLNGRDVPQPLAELADNVIGSQASETQRAMIADGVKDIAAATEILRPKLHLGDAKNPSPLTAAQTERLSQVAEQIIDRALVPLDEAAAKAASIRKRLRPS